jgi:hypothetical protein
MLHVGWPGQTSARTRRQKKGSQLGSGSLVLIRVTKAIQLLLVHADSRDGQPEFEQFESTAIRELRGNDRM